MKNMIMYKQGESSWITYIKKRINSNLNLLAIATGETGSGKSWSLLRIAYEIDPEFDVKQVAFSFRDVMKLLTDEEFKKKKWKIIIFDEAQIDISKRQWQSLTNKLFLALFSTFRHQNIIFMMSSPQSDFIDSASMKLVHAIFEVRGHSRKTNLTHLRPKLQQFNGKLNKFYHHSVHTIRNGDVMKVVNWMVKKPPEHLIDEYEKKKSDFTSKLNQDILRQLEEASAKEENKKRRGIELTDKQKVALYLRKSLKVEEGAKLMGISPDAFYRHLDFARKKGYTPKNYDHTNDTDLFKEFLN